MKPERKKIRAKGKKRRDPSKASGASQITSPLSAGTENLPESSMWAAPNETTTLVFSGDDTGRSDVTTTTRPTRRRAGRRHRLESTRSQREHVSSPSPRPKRVEVTRDDPPSNAGLSTSRGFQQKSSAEDVTRSSGGGRQFPQTSGSKPATRFRMMAPGEEEASKTPRAGLSIQADATAVGASQLDLTRGSSGHNLAPPSAVIRKEANVVQLSKKGSGQSVSEGELSSKDDASGPPAGAKGHSTPPCGPVLGRSYRSNTMQRSADGQRGQNATADDGEEESFDDESADLSTKSAPMERAVPMSEASTSSGHSKQIPRSLGQSWISQVSHEMAGGVTPHRGAVLALLKREMTKKTPEVVAKEAPGPDLHEVPHPCRKLSAISWASEGTYEPTSAVDSRVLKTTATSQSKETTVKDNETTAKDKEATVKAKETRSVHIAKSTENSIEVSDVPRVTLRRDSRPRRVVRVPKPKDSVFAASAKHLMAPVLVIPVLILFALLITFIVRKTPVRPRKTRLPEELVAACGKSTACIRAVKAMTEALDLTADPCSEFDRFACANWRSADLKRHSYRREIMQNYTQDIGEALLHVSQADFLKRQRGGDVDDGAVNMGAFYSSCLAFLDASDSQVANASDIIRAMGLDRVPLDNVTAQANMQSFLEFAVGKSFQSGLPSFVSVTLRGDKTFLGIGETLHSTLKTSRLVEKFLHSSLRTEGLAGDDQFLDVLYRVDLSADEWRSRDKPGPFTKTRAADLQLPFAGASWVDALNQGPHGANYSPYSMVFAKGVGEVVEIISILSDDNITMHHALAYASAVLLAQVLKYEHLFREEPADSRTAATDSVKRCLTATGTYFKYLLPQWITATLVSNARLRAFKRTVKHLQARVVHRSQGSRRTVLNGSEFSKLKVTITGENALADGRPPRTPSSSAIYGDQFLLNVVHASRDQVGADFEEGAVEGQLLGELSFSKLGQEGFAVAVPASVLVADALVADDKVPSLDYAAIGVRLLLDWAVATKAVEALTDQPATLEQRVQCVRDAASVLFGRSVGHEEGQLLAYADWALDVAWSAAEAHRRNPTGDSAGSSSPNEVVDDDSPGLTISRKFFYLRFCHTLCGDTGTLAGACRYRTARSRDFTRAFGCPDPPPLEC